MKKLIALAIVAVMLVAMAATVLANETVYAAPVRIDDTYIADGTISDGEYGRPIAHINSNTAYDIDHDEEEIDGYKGYVSYQQCDPFDQDVVIYIAVSGDTTGANAAQAGARLYFAFDELIPDGKFYGGFNGMAGEAHWSNTAAQFRVSFHDEPTGNVSGDLWASGKASNIIASIYTKDYADGYVTDGFVIASWDGLKDGAQLSVVDHTYDRTTLLVDSGCCAGSAGVHGSRAHFEFLIRSAYFYNADASFVSAEDNDYFLQPGDYFAFSFVSFIALNNDTWNGLISWGSGIDFMTNQSNMGATGSNKIVIPTWDEYYSGQLTPTGKSGSTEITATVDNTRSYEIIIPSSVRVTEAGITEIGTPSVKNVKNATDNTVISYTAIGTQFTLTNSGKTMETSYYIDKDGTTPMPDDAIEVYKNKAVVDPLTTIYVGVTEDAWKIADSGIYKATVTFNFEMEEQ